MICTLLAMGGRGGTMLDLINRNPFGVRSGEDEVLLPSEQEEYDDDGMT